MDPSRNRAPRPVGLALACLLAGLAAACATTRSYVSRSVVRGPYIDATLSVPGGAWRYLFPATPTCAAVLRLEAPVQHVQTGRLWGEAVSPDGQVCQAVGIGSLRRWRRARVEGEMAPSSTARWSVMHRDADAYLLRGRFPMASRLGVANTYDVVVLVANDATCAPVAESGEATLVYRQSGSQVLMLGPCPVQAVAKPL